MPQYVYGRGLIGEEVDGEFKTYHFDYRGSTVALTDINGNVTDRFEYDTYGKVTKHTGLNETVFMYNGRDGVVTDANGLIYMRARYYNPELRRFVNADILAGDIANSITLNRYAYANGNPVSLIDPRGLSAERVGGEQLINYVSMGVGLGAISSLFCSYILDWITTGKRDKEFESSLSITTKNLLLMIESESDMFINKKRLKIILITIQNTISKIQLYRVKMMQV